jgi:hypothetical protein
MKRHISGLSRLAARSMEGQTSNWTNPLTQILAAPVIHPISEREIEAKKYEKYDQWNNQLRMLGVHINNLAESLNTAKPYLSQESIRRMENLLASAVYGYDVFKGVEKSAQHEKVENFRQVILDFIQRHALLETAGELRELVKNEEEKKNVRGNLR